VKTRLLGWWLFVAFLTVIAYASQLSSGPPPKDVAYRWSSSIGGVIQYAIVFGIVMLITRHLDRREFLAFRRPRIGWWRIAGISAMILLAVFVVSAIVSPFSNPEREQGLIPERWEPSKIAPFAAYAAVVVLVAPFVEELMFRGTGYGLLEPYGRWVAIIGVGIAFALVHGLIAGFAIIATFGIGLAYLRARSGSIYPCMLLHAAFNAFGLAIGIATGG
jgi:membrane protease YdiL (CAAX protease family)